MFHSISLKHCYFLLLSFSFFYFVFFPQLPLIADEISYFNQGFAFAHGQKDAIQQEFFNQDTFNWINAKYPLGTGFFLAPFIFLLGNKAALLSGLFYFGLSYLLIVKLLKKLHLPLEGSFLFFLFLPLLFLSRSVMSELPSLLVLSLFYYLFFCGQKNRNTALLLGLLAGLSFWFRETNVLICGLFLLFRCYEKRTAFWPILIGGLLGVSLRFISAWWVYGNAIFLKGSDPFSLTYLFGNLPLYGIILLGLIPLGLVSLVYYRGPYWKICLATIFLFTVLHLSYYYNAIAYSGLAKSLIVNGRFFIPLIPLWCIFSAYLLQYTWFNRQWIKALLFTGALLLPAVAHYYAWNVAKDHQTISHKIFDHYQDHLLIFDASGYTSTQRYLHPFHGTLPKVLNLKRLQEPNIQKQLSGLDIPIYAILSHRFENEEKRNRAAQEWKILNALPSPFKWKKKEELTSRDGAIIQVWELQTNNPQ